MRNPPKLLTQISLIFTFSGCLLLALNSLSPMRIPWWENWSGKQEVLAQDKGLTVMQLPDVTLATDPNSRVLILDARETTLYDQGHIPGAVSTPVKALDESLSTVRLMATQTDSLLVYCSGKQCDESIRLGEHIKQLGYENVSIFLGGFDEWKASGQPIE